MRIPRPAPRQHRPVHPLQTREGRSPALPCSQRSCGTVFPVLRTVPQPDAAGERGVRRFGAQLQGLEGKRNVATGAASMAMSAVQASTYRSRASARATALRTRYSTAAITAPSHNECRSALPTRRSSGRRIYEAHRRIAEGLRRCSRETFERPAHPYGRAVGERTSPSQRDHACSRARRFSSLAPASSPMRMNACPAPS
jgi:hypothetical protein